MAPKSHPTLALIYEDRIGEHLENAKRVSSGCGAEIGSRRTIDGLMENQPDKQHC